ncbi:MAG: hypothetical protein II220_06145 [Spirochaetales bacterium]|nr:hypothetical protein [Spirochaetales bacterium]
MKKLFCFFIMTFVLCSNVFAQDNNKEETVEVPYFEIKPEIESVTTAELEFTDEDDSAAVSPALSKSSPSFEEELSAFIRFNRYGSEKFVFGPYGFYDGEMTFRKNTVLDYETKDQDELRSYFLPKKINGFGGVGFKVGFKREKKEFKGSSIHVGIPFSVFYDINDKDSAAINWEDKKEDDKPIPTTSEADYFTFFYIGSGLDVSGKLKSKTTKLEVALSNRLLFGFTPYAVADRADNFYLANSLNAKVEFSPFDFFCKEVNVTLEAGDKLDIERNTYHVQVKNRVWVGLTWKPVKYFKLITIPFYFKTDCMFKTDNLDYYYDWTETVYGKYGVYFGSDNIGFELSVSPDYWAAYREDSSCAAIVNADSLRVVTVTAELTLKY